MIGRGHPFDMTAQREFEQIDKKFAPMIWRIALSHEADRQMAEDLVQDIRISLWRALPSFRGQSSLRTFVARLATNCAISHVRKRIRVPRQVELSESLPAGEQTPEHAAIVQDQQEKLIAAVRALPLSLRQIALLALEGMTPAEMADVLGISANAAAIRLSRAKGALRNLIGEM